MKKAIAIVLAAAGMTGCFTSDVLVTIRPDGTGTVEQTVSFRPSSMVEFQRLASPDLAANPLDPTSAARELRTEMDKWAETMRIGRNLRLRSSESATTGETTERRLSFDIDDVSALELNLVPEIPGVSGFYVVAAKDGQGSTRLTTALEPLADGLERFTFRFPNFAMDPSAEPPASWATGSDAEMASFKNLMRGARITLAVESVAPIVRTNSPFRQENRVTLVDADIAQALFSKQIGMLATTPSTFDQLLTQFGGLPGVTLADARAITIDVQNPSTNVAAQPPPAAPSTDPEIYLATLLSDGGKLTVGPPINISNNPGYDNQPSFTPDGQEILFASSRGAGAPTGRGRGATSAIPPTDIYRYRMTSRQIWRVTNTPEAEFSPVMMPDGRNISVVRVEADGTQRLWQVLNNDTGNGASSVILPDIRPVGYYAWRDERSVALFVLGQNGQPSTLQVADTQTGKAELIASDIGRSIQRMPSGAISFVHRERGSTESVHDESHPQAIGPTVRFLFVPDRVADCGTLGRCRALRGVDA